MCLTIPQNSYDAFMSKYYPEMYELACKMQQEWNEIKQGCAESISTQGVKPNKLNKLYKQLKSVCEKPVCMTVNGQLKNNMCHQNSQFVEGIWGFERKAGYNVCACPCGAYMSFELHSVNKDANGKLVDFTTDYDGEKQKWYLPFKCKTNSQELLEHGLDECGHIGLEKCRCGGGWNVQTNELDVGKLEKTLRSVV